MIPGIKVFPFLSYLLHLALEIVGSNCVENIRNNFLEKWECLPWLLPRATAVVFNCFTAARHKKLLSLSYILPSWGLTHPNHSLPSEVSVLAPRLLVHQIANLIKFN